MDEKWLDKPASPDILEDVLEMIKTIKRDQKYGAYEMYYPDSYIIAMGGNPDDYEEIYPGVRRVKAT